MLNGMYVYAFHSSPSIAAYPYLISLINNREHDQLTGLINSRHIPVYLRELALGEVAAQKGEYGQALSHLKKAKYYGAAQPDSVLGRIHYVLAVNYEALDQPMEALNYYLKVTDIRFRWSNAFYGKQARDRILLLRGQLKFRRQQLSSRVATSPDSTVAQGEFGLYLLRTGEYALAATHLELANGLEPNNINILFNLGLAYLKSGDVEAAKLSFLKANTENTDDPKILNHLALIYAGQGDYDSAIALFERVLNKGIDNFNARYNLARLYYRLGDSELMMSLLRQGMQDTSGDVSERYRRLINELSVTNSE